MPIILGTAGHIDHGKTTLVKALTGINCDRTTEEKKRGITIELGFAFLDLDKERIGIIDVPGHERFVKNMVAGAVGIDMVLLVVAADEGVMPQTREHLEICTLLGVKKGIVVLTKTDMIDDPDWLELAGEDVKTALKGSFLENAPIIPVSAQTGTGIDKLKTQISETAKNFSAKRRSDLFRLSIDRVFSMRGHGTVVTGTGFSGRLKVGEEIMIYPKQATGKVRMLQVHGMQCEQTEAGLRTAINLSGFGTEDLERGQIIAHSGTLFPSTTWNLQLHCLPSARKGIKHRKEIHFYHGTKEILARLYLLDREILEPGDTCVCQVRFPAEMVGVYGDAFLVRAFSPLQTLAGGIVLDPIAKRIKRFSPQVEILAKLLQAETKDLILKQLELIGKEGRLFSELRLLTDMEDGELEKLLQNLASLGLIFCVSKKDRLYVEAKQIKEITDSLIKTLQTFHTRHPLKSGISRSELESGWGKSLSPRLFHFILERLIKTEKIRLQDESLCLTTHKVSLGADKKALQEQIVALYQQAASQPPKLKEAAEQLGIGTNELLPIIQILVRQGELVKVSADFFFAVQAINELSEQIRGFFTENDSLTPADFRELTKLSRKFAIPVLEYFDNIKLTIRVGDKRHLRGK